MKSKCTLTTCIGLLSLLLLANCDTSGTEVAQHEEEARIDLRMYQYDDGDTTLVGTFSLAQEQAFDLSQTTQIVHPTSSTIQLLAHTSFAHNTVPRGSLFELMNTINFPPGLSHIRSFSRDHAASKTEWTSLNPQDRAAFYYFILERSNVTLPEEIMVSYERLLKTDTDTLRVNDTLYVSSMDSKNVLRASQIDAAQGFSLSLVSGALGLYLEFDSSDIDDALYPCLVIENPIQDSIYETWVEEYCSFAYPDESRAQYVTIDAGRTDPLTYESVFRFFLLRKPAEDF